MTSKEKTALEKLYASWPSERLARAATKEKADYQPDAVALMLGELKKRELTGDAIEKIVLPPPLLPEEISLPQRDIWLLPARLNRRRYAIRTGVFTVFMIAAAFGLELFPYAQPTSFVVLLVFGLLYAALGLMLPRSKDAGVPSWIAIVFALFPFTAGITFIALLFAPSKSEKLPSFNL